ncbi:MAG: alpha/beta hydrolase [Agriterribacter sp.]
MLFVHGWCINKTYWQKQIDYFKNRFTVITPDLGGHGESGHNRKSRTVNDYAGDIISVINNLKLNKVILIGHSMGGDIILKAADSVPSKMIGFIGIDNFKEPVPTRYSPETIKQIDSFFVRMENNFDTVATAFSRASLFPPGYADTASVNRV